MDISTVQSSVLLVEDDDQEAFLLEKMLREEAGATHIIRAIEGQAALDVLKTDDLSLPGCIILDLKLSGEDGLWLLDRLLEQEHLAKIPVIVFSGDLDRLQRACSSFPNVVSSVRKPETLEQYRTILTVIIAIMNASLGLNSSIKAER